MAEQCDTCGNRYAKSFQVITSEKNRYTFDCLECAIQGLAPLCAHCRVKIIGHGLEVDKEVFCCSHCARTFGKAEIGEEPQISNPPDPTMIAS